VAEARPSSMGIARGNAKRAADSQLSCRAMRAARLTLAGTEPRFELQEVPEPVPAVDEVVVGLVTAALNRRDWWLWRASATPVPVTLGSDGAGRVVSVGAGVRGIAPGDEVVIDPALNWGNDERAAAADFDILGSPTEGTFAERVVVKAINVHPRPTALSWEESAAFPLAGLTAWRAVVTCAGAAPGRRLLITGGGSGVSTFCLQIAAAVGAEVWVTSGSDAKIARCIALGARGGFRYDDPHWPQSLVAATGGEGVHAVVDSFGGHGWAQALAALVRGGVLVNYGDTGGEEATIPVAELYWQWRSLVGTTMGSPREFRALCEHVSTCAWRPAIDSVHDLADLAGAARRLMAPDRFGKVVLRIG
jgi:zinc-binding alcohol dehydrogenase/oxidoreductase